MIAIVLIALAAGCASALMFASIISGALISLLLFYLAPLPLMVAALGWGPIAATIGGIAGGFRPRRDLRPALLHRLCHHRCAACLVARPPLAAGTAAAQCSFRQWLDAGGAATRMVSGRPHPALDRGLCRIDHDCGHADAWHGRRNHHQRTAPRPVANSGAARCGIVGRHRTLGRSTCHHRSSGRNDRRHDDVDAQSVARRQDHGDIRPAAAALARSEERGIAADDAGGAVGRAGLLLHRRAHSPCSRRSRPPP